MRADRDPQPWGEEDLLNFCHNFILPHFIRLASTFVTFLGGQERVLSLIVDFLFAAICLVPDFFCIIYSLRCMTLDSQDRVV